MPATRGGSEHAGGASARGGRHAIAPGDDPAGMTESRLRPPPRLMPWVVRGGGVPARAHHRDPQPIERMTQSAAVRRDGDGLDPGRTGRRDLHAVDRDPRHPTALPRGGPSRSRLGRGRRSRWRRPLGGDDRTTRRLSAPPECEPRDGTPARLPRASRRAAGTPAAGVAPSPACPGLGQRAATSARSVARLGPPRRAGPKPSRRDPRTGWLAHA
jgi:hypothetical protein